MGRKKNNLEYIIYTDGGCLSPGDKGACAAVVIDKNSVPEPKNYVFCEGYKNTSNNRMEIRALILGLKAVPKTSNVQVFSDSQYLINCFTGTWQRKANLDLFEALDKAASGKNVSCHWVPGHSGDRYNELCDNLCTLKMQDDEDLLEDRGYVKSEAAKKNESSGRSFAFSLKAMTVKLEVPETMRSRIEILLPENYSEKYHVNIPCAQVLMDFARGERRSFKDYAKLKTFGPDYWSLLYIDEIITDMGDKGKTAYDIIKSHIDDKKARVSAFKWYCRGLPLEDSMRKALVDREISANCKQESLI